MRRALDPRRCTQMNRTKIELRSDTIDAVILDMDGVITNTATIHSRAWTETFNTFLQELDSDQLPFSSEDYRHYVDGKPRYDGVRSFLDSRGIDLPEGSDDDPPSEKTIHGLGNRKNRRFRELLEEEPVEPFSDTVRFISRAKDAGLRIAVISASENAEQVLRAAGVAGLFEVRVDGVVMKEMGLDGKPAPDIFVEAARRLTCAPRRCVVVEDAEAGVQAGRTGNFAFVIGLARSGHPQALRKKGADWVASGSLDGVVISSVEPGPTVHHISAKDAPSGEDFLAAMGERSPVIFLDYDGTLTPIVRRPEDAVLSPEMRLMLERLAWEFPVAIVSGRDLNDLRDRVGIEGVTYAGSHGFQICGARIDDWEHPDAQSSLEALDKAEQSLSQRLEKLDGVQVERKRYAVAVHFRRAHADAVPEVENTVDSVVTECGLRKTGGKKVFELRPTIDWDKGKALVKIASMMDLEQDDIFPIYIGDDTTDEDAFAVVKGWGAGIRVGGGEETKAGYTLDDVDAVEEFLGRFQHSARAGSQWKMVYDEYQPEAEGLRETLCSLGNGYMVTRAASPDSSNNSAHYPGTYLAGGYNRLTTEVSGREIENEDLVNFPNWLCLSVRIENGDWFEIDRAHLVSFIQALDLKEGILRRAIRFKDDEGRVTSWLERRLVSMDDPHLAGLEVRIQPENWSGILEVRSGIDGDIINDGVERYRDLNQRHLEVLETQEVSEDTVLLHCRTVQSRLEVAEAVRTRVFSCTGPIDSKRSTEREQRRVDQHLQVRVETGTSVRIEKILSLHTSRDRAGCEAVHDAVKTLAEAPGFTALYVSHRQAWHQLWQDCDFQLTVRDGNQTSLKLRLYVFHLMQTISLHSADLDVGFPARGWHGEAYRGHIFWDELFIFPFLNLRLPMLTRSLLKYRTRRLPMARKLAADAGFSGAMFPWQSGSSGREESQVVHLNPESGRWLPDNTYRQRHVNLAIAYNIWRYLESTEDYQFLEFYGAEMMLEITRFWASIATYNQELDRYEIKSVMGPDEFHTAYPDADPSKEGGIDNNAYTNVMASWLIQCTQDLMERLSEVRRTQIYDKLDITDAELDRWDAISRKLRVVFHDDGIISQFEGYDDLEEFDWDGYRERYGDIQRLDRILESEGDSPNRYKASKQPDVLMLFFLFSADELQLLLEHMGYAFDTSLIPKNIQYYLARSSEGSSLSRAVHSWLLARLDRAASWHLFQESLDSDFRDIQGGTTPEGIHTGAMAGTVDLIHRCYTGLEQRGGILHFDPVLPDSLEALSLKVWYRRHKLAIEITRKYLSVTSCPVSNQPIKVAYRGRIRELAAGGSVRFHLRPRAGEQMRKESQEG